MHKFDATFKFNNLCEHLAKKFTTCSNLKILEDLPVNCEEGQSCLDIIDDSEISCSADDVPLPQIGCPGCFEQEDIDNLQNADALKSLAVQASAAQLSATVPNLLNSEDKCGANLVSVDTVSYTHLTLPTIYSV